MTSYSERQKLVSWLQHAVVSGARRHKACEIIGLNIRTLQRWVTDDVVLKDRRPETQLRPQNKLTKLEIQRVLNVCMSEEYVDIPPSRIIPMLADTGVYIASESSFYRILKAHKLDSHRGRAKRKGTYTKPESYPATRPNQVWTWDITHLPSLTIGMRFYLYLIVDIFSRKIVGAEVHEAELGEKASELLQRSVWNEKCESKGLILHSDNGSPMKSFTMQAKMYDLGVVASHSRPRVSNDNPFSESLFRTLKYCPQWPRAGFTDLEMAREWVHTFVNWYNTEHRHSGIKYVTPKQRHEHEDVQILEQRKKLYEQKKSENPGRWSGKTRNWDFIVEVELNPENRKAA
ncbi:MAG: putative transposase [Planctomycetaceae bacterium]|jgi:putative transposase